MITLQQIAKKQLRAPLSTMRMTPVRGFLDQLTLGPDLEGVTEASLTTNVDPSTRTFKAQMPIEFDIEGRMIIFDGLGRSLKRVHGLKSIAISLAGLYMFYSTPASYAFDLVALQHWGGISLFTFTTLLMTNYHFMINNKINRVYLLNGGVIARL